MFLRHLFELICPVYRTKKRSLHEHQTNVHATRPRQLDILVQQTQDRLTQRRSLPWLPFEPCARSFDASTLTVQLASATRIRRTRRSITSLTSTILVVLPVFGYLSLLLSIYIYCDVLICHFLLQKNDPKNPDPTFTNVPDIKLYQDRIDDNRALKRKQPTPSKRIASTAPPINVYVNTGEQKDSSSPSRPLTKDKSVLDLTATPIPIHDILNVLQEKMPECNYLTYEDGLKNAGFHYASQVLDNASDTNLFAAPPVKMPIGMVRTFVKGVRAVVDDVEGERESKRRRLDEDHPRAEKENKEPNNRPVIVLDD